MKIKLVDGNSVDWQAAGRALMTAADGNFDAYPIAISASVFMNY
jgi:hypothetical protein